MRDTRVEVSLKFVLLVCGRRMTYKGSFSDEIYLAARRKVSERVGPQELWSVIDQWPLYVGLGNLSRFVAIYEIFKKQIQIPGDIAEFGSWRGANLMFMAKLLEILDPHGSKRVHCFDNFSGLPPFSSNDGSEDGKVGEYCGSLEDLRLLIDLYNLNDTISIYPGAIENTLREYLDSDKGVSFSLIYYDADLYEPASVVLELAHERLMKGGIFVFDEWNHPAWPGEGLAVREFMARHGHDYISEHIAGTRQPSLIIRKIA